MWIGRIVGLVLLLVGGLWTLQGFGIVGGSFMTGSTTWLVIGLALVLAGVALLARRPRGRPDGAQGRVEPPASG